MPDNFTNEPRCEGDFWRKSLSYLSSLSTKASAAVTGIKGAVSSLVGYQNVIPVGTYNSSTVVLTNGQSIEPQLDVNGKIKSSVGYVLKKVSGSFVRPSDTTAYTIGDAMTDSTSAPTILSIDLASVGAVAGQSVEIRKLAVVSSAKQATLPLINAYVSATTFTGTNDNAALSIDDTTMEAGGAWLSCDVQNFTALNSRCAYVNVPAPMILAAADTKFYVTLQAANAYTPVSGEKFTVIAWVALL